MSDNVIHPKPATATRHGAERITDLWPQLSDDVRLELVEIAEAAAAGEDDDGFVLTPEQLAIVVAAKRDFAEGRTMTLEELEQSLDRFFADRQRGASSSPRRSNGNFRRNWQKEQIGSVIPSRKRSANW